MAVVPSRLLHQLGLLSNWMQGVNGCKVLAHLATSDYKIACCTGRFIPLICDTTDIWDV